MYLNVGQFSHMTVDPTSGTCVAHVSVTRWRDGRDPDGNTYGEDYTSVATTPQVVSTMTEASLRAAVRTAMQAALTPVAQDVTLVMPMPGRL